MALGSGLESAACLDVCFCKSLISAEQQIEGKEQLVRIVRMLMRLREAPIGRVREEREEYGTKGRRLLVRLVPLILGLRGYLDQSGKEG